MAKRKQENYLSDKYVTSVLLKDMQNGKVSDELAKIFMEIQKRVLSKPNFSGYYAGVKDAIISEGTILFLSNWYKFKPYRVKNNYEYKDSGNFLIDEGVHKSKELYTNRCFEKYDMLEIINRTYSVESCEKIADNKYKINLFNKLKTTISKDENIIFLKPKVDLFDYNSGKLVGGFTFLTTFAFTGATNKINQMKAEKRKTEELLSRVNENVYHTLNDFELNEDGYVNINLGGLF